MLSSVGESAQVALQATTIGSSPQQAAQTAVIDKKNADKAVEGVSSVGKTNHDSVVISDQAKQLSSVALNSIEKPAESGKEKSREEASRNK